MTATGAWRLSRSAMASKATLPEQKTRRRTAAGSVIARIVEHLLERAVGEVLDRRAGLLHAQRPLGREQHQRLADVPADLAPQQVEVLRRGGGVADLDVVLGARA